MGGGGGGHRQERKTEETLDQVKPTERTPVTIFPYRGPTSYSSFSFIQQHHKLGTKHLTREPVGVFQSQVIVALLCGLPSILKYSEAVSPASLHLQAHSGALCRTHWCALKAVCAAESSMVVFGSGTSDPAQYSLGIQIKTASQKEHRLETLLPVSSLLGHQPE